MTLETEPFCFINKKPQKAHNFKKNTPHIMLITQFQSITEPYNSQVTPYSAIFLVRPNLWVSSCAGQPCAGPSACLACGTWRYRWAPVTPARRWSCSSCPCDASRSGCEPLCGGRSTRREHTSYTDHSPLSHHAGMSPNKKKKISKKSFWLHFTWIRILKLQAAGMQKSGSSCTADYPSPRSLI